MSSVKNKIPYYLRGSLYRSTHQASAIAILGDQAPPIRSKGICFENIGRWTARFFQKEMAIWCTRNPQTKIIPWNIKDWVRKANNRKVSEPCITIADTPDRLPEYIAHALIGGIYHECWHSKYSRMDPLVFEEMWSIIEPKLSEIPFWEPYLVDLRVWGDIFEDIRIERCGTAEYPGSINKMKALQEFILQMESSRDPSSWTPLEILARAVRDIGLGYEGEVQEECFTLYERVLPGVLSFIKNGTFSEFVKKATCLTPKDNLAYFEMAFETVLFFFKSSSQPSLKRTKTKDQKESLGETSQDGSSQDGSFQDGSSQDGSSQDGSSQDGSSQDGSSQDGSSQDGSSQGGSSQGGSSQDGSSQGGSSQDGPSQEGSFKEGPSREKGETPLAGEGGTSEEGGGTELEVCRFEEAERALLESFGVMPPSVADFSSSMESFFMEKMKEEEKELQSGEALWYPYDASMDQFFFVQPSKKGKEFDKEKVGKILEMVRKDTSYLRSRMRKLFRSLEMVTMLHGVPFGKEFSEKTLVDSYCALKSGEIPDRAYKVKDETIDSSVAVAIVMDESGSMEQLKKEATAIMLSLAEPLSQLGCALQVTGLRQGKDLFIEEIGNMYLLEETKGDKSSSQIITDDDRRIPKTQVYHRSHGVIHDIFKSFDEKFNHIRWRFANVKSTGSTPLSDGIQLALASLNERKEAHRIIFVFTDGNPDSSHEPVIRRQLRLAKECGIHIVGIGFGQDCKESIKMFPDHLWSEHASEIPVLGVAKLSSLLDWRALKRGISNKEFRILRRGR